MYSVRLLVLGSILRKGISHGYGVYSDITSWRAETWTSVKPGSIYHALEKLELQGMTEAVDSRDNIKLGPSRTEYAVTLQGKDEFESLLESALLCSDIQLFSAGIAFMEMISREKVISLLNGRCASLNESAHFLKALPTEAFPSDPSKHPELLGIWVSYLENQAAYTQKIVDHIQSGKYSFKKGENE
ncbi:PadR family transcriptional regulator [Paenibacillus sp. RC67]|uniref:PadR family transcriptional regulator n=1 Tax=Paenibacillus sp. RC67 TaxID=3039392 RepID=UPI0024AD76E9|nr:PadR family transcriptional regulator [Paenibacillus sp. RC67]